MHFFKRRFFAVSFWILLTRPLIGLAQLPDFNVQVLDESNGIQTGDILGLVKDKQGFVWMLSSRHLQRFDGQHIKRIETDGDDLIDVASDSAGTIWTTAQFSIKRYVNDYKGFETVRIEGPPFGGLNKLSKIEITPDNQIWVNATTGLYRYERDRNLFKFYPIKALPDHKFYRRIFNRKDYKLFMADIHTVFTFDVRTGSVQSVPFDAVKTIVPLSEDVAWITNSRLRIFEVNFKTKSVTPVSGLPFADISSIIPLGGTDYLVNTSQGCYKYDRADGSFFKAILYDSGNELPNDENYTDYYDPSGTLWIVCQEGVVFFKPLEHNIGWLRGFTNDGKKWSNNIRAITEDRDGNIWLGTIGGFYKLNFATGKVKSYQSDPETRKAFHFPSVRGMIHDGNNLIIGPQTGEPLIFNPYTETFSALRYPAGQEGAALKARMKNEQLATIYPMHNGDFLIVGEESCYLLEKNSYKVSERNFIGAYYNIQTVAQEKGGNFWMGSYRGLLYVDKNFKTLYSDSQFSPTNVVTSLLIRNDSTVWCGSVGLFEVVRRKNGLVKKLIFPQLKNQHIAILYRDKTGRIWIAADDGLYRYDEVLHKLEWFDVWDNIQNKRFNPNALLEAKNGFVYLGGFNGLNYFKPEQIKSREEKLDVTISNVRINQDDSLFLLSPAPLRLNWKQNSVEFQFVTTYYRNPEKLIYRYRLIGLDHGWLMNGRNNKVRFSSLSSGEYTFTVAASLDGIRWYETRSPFKFVISPPFWQRTWFILLCLVAYAGIAYWWFKRRLIRIRKQTAMRERVSEIEMKALRAQMNPHFIFNCLNSINRYIVKSDNATASLYLTRFSKLIRLILDNSNSKKVLLSNELEALKLYVEMEGLRFDNKFECKITMDENVYPDSIEVPSLIIQPYVENAIWHGLLHKETNGSLYLKVSMVDENLLQCIVEDNGIGREKAREYKSKSASSKKSLGMKLTEDRINILNQYAKTNATIEIIDLEDAQHIASGTRVVIRIPV